MPSNASTQINLPSELIYLFKQIQNSIPDEHLMGQGKYVGAPHVTVKYGVNDLDRGKLNKIVKDNFPFYISFGDIKHFQPTVYSDGTCPLYIEVISEQLHKLHKDIDKNLNCLKDNHPDYKPHITLAYLKPDKVKSTPVKNLLKGKEFIAKELVYSDKDENEEIFS